MLLLCVKYATFHGWSCLMKFHLKDSHKTVVNFKILSNSEKSYIILSVALLVSLSLKYNYYWKFFFHNTTLRKTYFIIIYACTFNTEQPLAIQNFLLVMVGTVRFWLEFFKQISANCKIRYLSGTFISYDSSCRWLWRLRAKNRVFFFRCHHLSTYRSV